MVVGNRYELRDVFVDVDRDSCRLSSKHLSAISKAQITSGALGLTSCVVYTLDFITTRSSVQRPLPLKVHMSSFERNLLRTSRKSYTIIHIN